jgi:hypothetical protein
MLRLSFVAVLPLVLSTLCAASTSYIVPTTTLTAQTSNNTSAANSFATQSNGNRGAGNISKVDVHTLLYPGATTKVYAHLMLWFGGSNHMNVGYSSTNPVQVKSQIDDMVSRGIDGVIIDWYGPNNSIDQATQLVMAEAENHPGFTFAIMIDQGAIQWYSCPGCSPQEALISQLQYIERTYFPSSAYMTIQGQPVVTNFNIDLSYSVDWNAANAALSTHPLFIFQNNNGFSHTLSDGSYSWVMPTTTDYGMGYLSSFYDAGMSFPSEQTVGATYKGFNDTLASWGSNRIMKQQCGQTWLQTFSEINGLYNSAKPLPDLQLVTWNDYEEATEIESGIDNCLTLSASVSTNALQWTINGNENTVDHYSVYISSDGENLMPLTNVATGIHSLNLCGFAIPAGNYQLFAQAVGKPNLANQITSSVSYTPSCPITTPTPPPPSVTFSASPASLTLLSGRSGTLTVTAATKSGAFNNPINLSCSGLPSTLNCSFSPNTITPGEGTATSVLTISTAAATAKNLPEHTQTTPLYAGWLLPFGIAGLAFVGKIPYQRGGRLLAVVALIGIGMISVSCGGDKVGASQSATAVTSPVSASYSFTVQGSASSSQLSTTVNVIIQ